MKQFFKKTYYWSTRRVACAAAVLVAAVACGFLFSLLFRRAAVVKVTAVRSTDSRYSLISPLYAVDVGESKDFHEFSPLRTKIKNLESQLTAQGRIQSVGLYLRDFDSGHWVGENENDMYFPGSLLKVPLMIAFYKQAETDPGILSTTLVYDGKTDANALEFIKPSQNLVAGQKYTIDELIRRMIVFSDNNAANLLVANIDNNDFREIYSDLGITLPTSVDDNSNFMSAKQYSLFFRVLRNATYLNQEYSEKALELLSQVEFKDGIVSGVPSGVRVAHKFGEHYDGAGSTVVHQLHDCGIVYEPKHYYLLCIMTRGASEPDLQDAIRQFSMLVHTEVVNNYQ